MSVVMPAFVLLEAAIILWLLIARRQRADTAFTNSRPVDLFVQSGERTESRVDRVRAGDAALWGGGESFDMMAKAGVRRSTDTDRFHVERTSGVPGVDRSASRTKHSDRRRNLWVN